MSKKQFPSTLSEWCDLMVNYMEIQDFVKLPYISLLWYTWNDMENVLENCETILEKVLENCLNFFSENLYSPCYIKVNIMAGYYPRPVLAFGYCHRLRLCVRVCINHLLVRTITHQPFTLESPNLDERHKTPWLRCQLFWGVIDLDRQGQS